MVSECGEVEVWDNGGVDKVGKNILLAYWLVVCHNLFFWMAPWLLFYLRFVSMGQVVVIQALGLLTRVVAEIPTGAISDLLGKKRALFIAFGCMAVGEGLIVWRQEYVVLVLSFIVVSLGYSFYSGTMEAFIYDTLVSGGKEKEYAKVLSRQQALTNLAIASASLIGGLVYQSWVLLPWILTTGFKLLGLVLVVFVDEPDVDTEKFSLKSFIRQTRMGFSQLLAPTMRWTFLLLLTYGIFQTFAWEMLDDMSVVAYGYSAAGIGVLYSLLTYLTVPFGLLYHWVQERIAKVWLLVLGIGVLGLNYLFSPWIGVYVWTSLFVLRMIYSPIKEATITHLINSQTASQVRATTISTYELVRKIPYLLIAGMIGGWVDHWGVKWVAFGFAAALVGLTLPQLVFLGLKREKYLA